MNTLVPKLCLAVLLLCGADCAKILGLWVLPGRSHFILGSSLMKGLAEMGHDVTFVSPFRDKVSPKNVTGSYREVVLEELLKGVEEQSHKRPNFFQLNDQDSMFSPAVLATILFPVIEGALQDTNMQALLNSGEKFDVVILEQFFNDAYRAMGPHFNAHLVTFSSTFASSWVNDLTGNPAPVSYVPEILTSYPPGMTFWQRTHNGILYVVRRLIFYLYQIPKQETLRKTYFPDSPSIEQLSQNISLVLLNSHESYTQSMPLTPNMIPIGGYHIKPPKKLPADLQQFLDNAKEGVVYFSMGSNLKSSDLPEWKQDIFLKAFAKLKQKVLWKFEEDLPGKPENVEIRNWLPQSDLLAHKNIKLFVTHGGILSASEAIYHGIPLLSIPVYGDQITNAMASEEKGYAMRINYHEPDWSEEKLSKLLDQLLNNQTYREKAKAMSKLFHDRPMTPMQTVDYWVRYVVRSKGAHHLRVIGTHLPWYQYYLVDVLFFLSACSLVLLFVTFVAIRAFLRRKNNSKTKKKKA